MAWRNNGYDPFACPQDWERTTPYDSAGDIYVPDIGSSEGQEAMLEFIDIVECFAQGDHRVPPGLDNHDAAFFADLAGRAMLEDGGLS